MYAHIIPRVYQKQWHSSNGSGNVYYYDKANISQPNSPNGGNVGNHFGEIDEYFITTKDHWFGITSNSIDELESYFNKEFENKWNDIVNSNLYSFICDQTFIKGQLNTICSSNLQNTPFNGYLLEFIVIQFLRSFDNFMKLDNGIIDGLLQLSFEIAKENGYPISESNLSALKNDMDYKRAVWKSILLDCKNKSNQSSFLNLVMKGLANCNPTFFAIKNSSARFILSDNPVIWNAGSIKKYPELESGIYFAITPSLMVAYLRYPDDTLKEGDAACLIANDDFVKHINYLLHNQCYKEIGFMNKIVNNHIVKSPSSQVHWNSMF